MNNIRRRIVVGLGLAVATTTVALRAHCDTLEGPVVLAARAALAKGDVTPVLKWVKADEEPTIRAAFARTAAVRKQSKEAAELADLWFFETLVRVHRAGEGAPYTGLKSGIAMEPGIASADHSLATGRPDAVVNATIPPLEAALKAKFERVAARQPHASHTVAAGREYVAAYVDYMHFAEHLAKLTAGNQADNRGEHAH